MRRPCGVRGGHAGRCQWLVSLGHQFFFHAMATLLKALLECLRILRSAKVHIKLFPRYRASFLAYLGRKLTRREWRCSWPRCNQTGTSRSPKPAGPLFPGGGTSSYSMSGGSACLGEYAVAASTVPASSASQPLGFDPEGRPSSDPPSPTGSPLPIISPADRLETISRHSVMGASSATSDFVVPDGRFLQLINSEQVRRYTKNITM
jgi:hypothetical protein